MNSSSGNPLNDYSPLEEKLNVISHVFGLFLSILGLSLLVLRTWDSNQELHLLSSVIFGGSMVLLYAASTFYHNCRQAALRFRLKILLLLRHIYPHCRNLYPLYPHHP